MFNGIEGHGGDIMRRGDLVAVLVECVVGDGEVERMEGEEVKAVVEVLGMVVEVLEKICCGNEEGFWFLLNKLESLSPPSTFIHALLRPLLVLQHRNPTFSLLHPTRVALIAFLCNLMETAPGDVRDRVRFREMLEDSGGLGRIRGMDFEGKWEDVRAVELMELEVLLGKEVEVM
ncbi:hypothetical protein BC829DRAFT_51825 [Chytridium lagenaria]|nr:hypothetical protein BC829DRAFT_51825 [Chytridium lagenaria]